MHWAAEMGLRLLQERHACRTNSSSNSSSSSSKDACFWGPWMESLPQSAVTPVEFTAAEVQQLVMPSAVQVRGTAVAMLQSRAYTWSIPVCYFIGHFHLIQPPYCCPAGAAVCLDSSSTAVSRNSSVTASKQSTVLDCTACVLTWRAGVMSNARTLTTTCRKLLPQPRAG
jgi:hypothetical protein